MHSCRRRTGRPDVEPGDERQHQPERGEQRLAVHPVALHVDEPLAHVAGSDAADVVAVPADLVVEEVGLELEQHAVAEAGDPDAVLDGRVQNAYALVRPPLAGRRPA